ncbi:synaptogyrin-2-like [Oscarella lobularis]|uniref:synaptogyrin-2-like n=1 Tax=Oscarella lobularis TaxID=121494 RepID=UPI0033139C9E
MAFDLLEYIKTPRVILRLFAILFAVIVFGCISDGVTTGSYAILNTCAFDHDDNACRFGIAVGVLAFVDGLVFLVVYALVQGRDEATSFVKYAAIADFVVSIVWSFTWLVCFCYLADRWRTTAGRWTHLTAHVQNNAQAALAFSFFSIGVWVALEILAFLRWRKLVSKKSEADVSQEYPPGQP